MHPLTQNETRRREGGGGEGRRKGIEGRGKEGMDRRWEVNKVVKESLQSGFFSCCLCLSVNVGLSHCLPIFSPPFFFPHSSSPISTRSRYSIHCIHTPLYSLLPCQVLLVFPQARNALVLDHFPPPPPHLLLVYTPLRALDQIQMAHRLYQIL